MFRVVLGDLGDVWNSFYQVLEINPGHVSVHGFNVSVHGGSKSISET